MALSCLDRPPTPSLHLAPFARGAPSCPVGDSVGTPGLDTHVQTGRRWLQTHAITGVYAPVHFQTRYAKFHYESVGQKFESSRAHLRIRQIGRLHGQPVWFLNLVATFMDEWTKREA